MHFIPPYPDLLFDLINAGQMPSPLNAEIHTGELDWQSSPKAVKKIAEALGIPLHIVPGAGHALPKDYVGKLLNKWGG